MNKEAMKQQTKRDRVFINEVVTRDGFQMESNFIETDQKIDFINQLSQVGYSKIEVTSFTAARAIPALRDAELVMGQIKRNSDVIYTALVPNLRGAQRALDCSVQEFNLVMSTSETHNRVNLRMSRDESSAQLSEVIDLAKQHKVPVNVSLSACFGCPMEGDISQLEVLRWVRYFQLRGVQGVTLCDTTGMAFPSQVRELCAAVIEANSELEITAHFHNTRGLGAANSLAAYEAGIRRFDASAGGLGGCPYAPGATGNVCTEELVHLLELEGIYTGVDLDLLLSLSAALPDLVGHDVPSQLLKAGTRLRKHAAPNEATFA
jgi:hydroxymethylglutaryl-CoA lyase